MTNLNKYFKHAKHISYMSDCKIKIGCVIVYKNRVLSTGFNTTKSHPIQKAYNIYRSTDTRYFDVDEHINQLHAEMMALNNLPYGLNKNVLSKCSIFIYREQKDGNTGNCKPCAACSKRLEELNIKNIYYTTENGYVFERR